MRRKILLVTIWDYKNFGNRLQALALKKIIENLGYDVTCAIYKKESIKRRSKNAVKKILGHIGLKRFRKAYLHQLRISTIKHENKLYQPITKTIHNYNTHKKINPEDYIAAVTGSDQVWHHWGKMNDLPYFYLSFMPSNKRISYAASFGFECFTDQDLSYHREGLNGMRYISCREETGCELVSKITGMQGKLVLDPTLCVERTTWMNIEKAPRYFVPSKYLLVFILGDQSIYRQTIKKYAQEHQLEIVDLFDYNRESIWTTTIENFLWLVHHAEYICTDSFHCTAFSILFEKKFTVFHRRQKGFEHMFDRIATLLNSTGLQCCEYNNIEIHDCECDYIKVMSKLKVLVQDSTDWLKKSLWDMCNENKTTTN